MSLFLISCDWRFKEKFKGCFCHPFLREFTLVNKLLDTLQQEQPMLLVVDSRLGKSSQAELLEALKTYKTTPPILMIEEQEILKVEEYRMLNIRTVKRNGLDFPAFLSHLEQHLAKEQAHEAKKLYEPCNLVGKSHVMQEIKAQLKQYAPEDCTIHLYGETGTGKEIAANYLHHLRFPHRNIIPVNCSLLSGSLGNAMFFGHAKGAFTDGNNELNGLIHDANNTTLFLDEVENLSLTFQGYLLRLLEDGCYRRYGDSHLYTSRFRLVTASNERLTELIHRNVMRKDFFYRISDVRLTLPPLRDHKEDIPLLCSHYFSIHAPHKILAEEDLSLLHLYHWPGNVRQLFSTLRRCIIKSKEKTIVRIKPEDLDLKIS